MKKIYKKPYAKEVKFTACNIMAGSINDVTVDPTKTSETMDSKQGFINWEEYGLEN